MNFIFVGARMLDDLLEECKRLKNEIIYLKSFLSVSDKMAFFSAIAMIIGVFLPWISAPGFFTHIGLMGGGDLHIILSILTLNRVVQVANAHRAVGDNPGAIYLLPLTLKRISFTYLLFGLASTMIAVFMLLYFGTQYAVIHQPIDIRAGFYLTLGAGGMIFCSGLARFLGEKPQKFGRPTEQFCPQSKQK